MAEDNNMVRVATKAATNANLNYEANQTLLSVQPPATNDDERNQMKEEKDNGSFNFNDNNVRDVTGPEIKPIIVHNIYDEDEVEGDESGPLGPCKYNDNDNSVDKDDDDDES